jgi:hypothetical protein
LRRSAQEQSQAFRNSVALVFGVAVATTVLGIVAALAGRIVGQLGSGVRYAVGAVPVVMGLHLLGWVLAPINSLPHRLIRSGWLWGRRLVRVSAALVLTLAEPLSSRRMSYVAYKSSIILGAVLLLLYGMAQVPSSKVTDKVPRSPARNSRMVETFVSKMDSMTTLPLESLTANRSGCLMHVESNIFFTVHEGASFRR